MLDAARLLLDKGFFTSANNRAYYAVFYAANALLITKGISHSKHTGVISAFRQEFIKTGLIAPEFSKIYGRLMEDRHESDYDLGSSVTKAEAELNYSDAEKFILEVQRWLKQEEWL